MAVFTAQALLGLALFKCLCCGLEKTLPSAVMCTQHTQGSGALTLLLLMVVIGCCCQSADNLSSTIAVFPEQEKAATVCVSLM